MGRAKTALGPCFTPFCQPYAREGQAVVCPLLRGSSPTRWVAPKQHWGPALLLFVSLTRARARPWSARCYGVARQRDGSRQNSIGVSGVLSLRHFGLVLFIHFGAWVPKNLARRVLIYWFRRRDAARPDRAAWAVQRRLAARWRGRRPDRNSWLRGPCFTPFCQPYAREGQAVVCPLLRGSSPTRWVAPKQHWGLRRAFSPAFRAGSLYPFWRVGAEESGAASKRKTRRLLTNRPCSSLVYEESDSKERLRVSNWIVQRLYKYAVKKTVELWLLTVFQHVV